MSLAKSHGVENLQNGRTEAQDQFTMGDQPSTAVDETNDSRAYKAPPSSFSTGMRPGTAEKVPRGLADFFNPEIFQLILHNPATAHRLLKFSQARMCGENMEFLEKVDRYHGLLDELATVMTDIHENYTSNNASKQLGINENILRKANQELREKTVTVVPAMENIFLDAQNEVETLLRTSIYPRFVKYQVTNSASKALSSDKGKYQGLGDCFCLTDPHKADNPIVFASDGFVGVTGYSRSDIIPRNCRFLQGNMTDRSATYRLKKAIEDEEEVVELLLNYRKNGEPFWNLLYVAPLYDSKGRLQFFIGGQINCSTTIRNQTDVLRILSMSDSAEEDAESAVSIKPQKSNKKGLFGFARREHTPTLPASSKKVEVREDGMEPGLLKQIEKMDFRKQMERFYTAYSKYLVVKYDTFDVEFFSNGLLEILDVNARAATELMGSNVFKFLGQHATALPREFKTKVQQALKAGLPISASLHLFTPRSLARKEDDKFYTHWTPVKNEQGQAKHAVMTLSSTVYE